MRPAQSEGIANTRTPSHRPASVTFVLAVFYAALFVSLSSHRLSQCPLSTSVSPGTYCVHIICPLSRPSSQSPPRSSPLQSLSPMQPFPILLIAPHRSLFGTCPFPLTSVCRSTKCVGRKKLCTYTHAHTPAHTRAYAHARMHAHARTPARPHARTPARPHARTRTSAHRQSAQIASQTGAQARTVAVIVSRRINGEGQATHAWPGQQTPAEATMREALRMQASAGMHVSVGGAGGSWRQAGPVLRKGSA